MSSTRRFLTALRSALFGTRGSTAQPTARTSTPPPVRPGSPPATRSAQPPSRGAGQDTGETSAGRTGPDATTELEPTSVRRPGWGYAPQKDGALDPGEIVWTWVPYEERDGRGKDRPVVVVATLGDGAVLAVQLTSKDHTGDTDFVPLGVGGWDQDRRPSWVAIDRIFRVTPGGVRREGTFVDATRYGLIERAMRSRFGWR